jgi:hypothetical protein
MRTLICLLMALGLMACTDDLLAAENGLAKQGVTGVVRVPLTARGAGGKTYRLRDATFEITGAAMFTLGERDARGPEADTLVTTLPAGSYTVYLRPGWQLVAQNGQGSESPALATLSSKNPMSFEIGRTVDARLTLTLHAGEEDLLFGAASPVKVTQADNAVDSAL